jgi:chitodextrinase
VAIASPASSASPNLLQDPSLETASGSTPTCWKLGGYGTNTYSWTHTTDSHTGSYAENLTITSWSGGDRKLVSALDSGTCAPAAIPSHTYTVSAWYKIPQGATGTPRFFAYYRTSSGSWTYWTQSTQFASNSSWTQVSWTTPPFPSGATNISVGMGLKNVGSVTMDDFSLTDNNAAAPDSTPPTAPASLTATPGESKVALSWSASSDPDSAVAGYYVFRNGTQVAQVSGTNYTDPALKDGTSYSYYVKAYDPSGNLSSASSTVSATPVDTTPPSIPSGLTAAPGDHQVGLSWSPSTDNVAVAGYAIYRNGTLVGTSSTASYTDTGLTDGTTYSYTVAAYDAAGNTSVQSSSITATPQATAQGPCGTQASPAAGGYQHIVWIFMENHAYEQIVGSSAAPFENQLAGQCGLATNYHAISHPSLPNYVAATSGSTQGITDDNPPSSHLLNVENIFHQLPAGQSRSLEESMTSNCQQADAGNYVVHHNPEAYYTNVLTDCANYDVPLGSTPDLSAKFTFVKPNICNDMHDCSIQTGDTWLQGFFQKLYATPQWQAGNTAVFLTFDEDDGSHNNHVYTAVVAPSVKPGTQSATAFDHYSLLRTAEDLLGLPAIGNAASATGMESAFNLGQTTTGGSTPGTGTVSHFSTLPSGSGGLPQSDSLCASEVRPAAENRSGNATANNAVPSSPISWPSTSFTQWATDRSKVTGNYTGTTDEILQWGACKWGIDEDILRAVAAEESWWHQTTIGDDCGVVGEASYGIMQVKNKDCSGSWVHGGYPDTANETALNVDYYAAHIRACFDGAFSGWLYNGQTIQQWIASNGSDSALWGCIGQWYSGGWYDSGAQSYITDVQNFYNTKPWLASSF